MNTLEDRLRDSLHHRATLPRLGDDIAGDAIHGARTRQRRRLTLGAVTAAVVLVTSIAGVALAGGPSAAPIPGITGATRSGPPSTSPSVGPSLGPTEDTTAARHGIELDGLDVLDHFRLVTVEGRRFTLPVNRLAYLVRIPAGWLYGNFDEPGALLRTDGTSVGLPDLRLSIGGVDAPARPAISSDGRSVAWVTGSTLHAAKLTASGLTGLVSSPVPPDSFALGWIGSRVVVGHSYDAPCCGGNHAEYDTWDPTMGDFVSQWTRDIYPFAGPVPEGVLAYVRVRAPGNAVNQGCLVRVDGVASMATQSLGGCPAGLGWFSQITLLSPNARYIIDTDLRDRTLAVYAVVGADTQAGPVGHCPADVPMAWETDQTYIAFSKTTHTVIRCRVGSDQPEPLGMVPDLWSLVPRYGV